MRDESLVDGRRLSYEKDITAGTQSGIFVFAFYILLSLGSLLVSMSACCGEP